MAKKLALILFIFSSISIFTTLKLNSQTLPQMGFIIKKGLVDVETVAVIFYKPKEEQMVKEARTASLVSGKKFHLYGISTRADIPRALYSIQKLAKPAIIVMTDETALGPKGVKYITEKVSPKKIPVISNRDKDTLEGGVLCVVKKDDRIETHVNKLVALLLEINFSPEFLSECIADVE